MVCAWELKEGLNSDVSLRTITRRVVETGRNSRIARKKPYISPMNRNKRVEFAKEHLSKPMEFWKTMIWSDELKFELVSNERRKRCWRKPGEVLKLGDIQPTFKHGGGSVMVWGVFHGMDVAKSCSSMEN